MRVFIGMETSGRSRRAFAANGHDVISCDLLPADDGVGWYETQANRRGRHWQGDVFDCLRFLRLQGWWPAFALFHPTCTYLTFSAEWAYGNGPYHQKVRPETLVGADRRAARAQAIALCRELVDLDIERIVVENPKGAFDACSPGYQVVQPYMFGDDASKQTHLHLVRTQPLEIPPRAQWAEPRIVNGRPRWANQTDSGQNRLSPGAHRWKARSETFPGLARAFAASWGPAQCEAIAA